MLPGCDDKECNTPPHYTVDMSFFQDRYNFYYSVGEKRMSGDSVCEYSVMLNDDIIDNLGTKYHIYWDFPGGTLRKAMDVFEVKVSYHALGFFSASVQLVDICDSQDWRPKYEKSIAVSVHECSK